MILTEPNAEPVVVLLLLLAPIGLTGMYFAESRDVGSSSYDCTTIQPSTSMLKAIVERQPKGHPGPLGTWFMATSIETAVVIAKPRIIPNLISSTIEIYFPASLLVASVSQTPIRIR
jgi:hypothetical protein